MDVNKVIELGKIVKPEHNIFSQVTTVGWIIISILLFLGLVLIVLGFLGILDDDEACCAFGVVMFLIAFGVFMFYQTLPNPVYQSKLDHWRNTIAKPYIESLPIEKKEISLVNFKPEKVPQTPNAYYWESGYTEVSSFEKSPITVSYIDHGIVTRTNWYETHMELSDHAKPYIEYQHLQKDLGNQVNAGLYNVKVYIPESLRYQTDLDQYIPQSDK